MAKTYEFYLDHYQIDDFFSIIRTKKQVIALLMKTIKMISIYEMPDSKSIGGRVILTKDKMSRLFYISDEKYFSINFPFGIIEDADSRLTFYSNHIDDIDNSITSDVLSILSNEKPLTSKDILEFAEPICDIANYKEDFWSFFRELILFEDGYIRFDHDNDQSRVHETKHPINHYDICYTSDATFKVGLKSKIRPEQFIDLVNTNTDCHFIQ